MVTWAGHPVVPPAGYELAEIAADSKGRADTLYALEREEGARRGSKEFDRIGLEMMAANGVPHAKVKTCEWARSLAVFVLATGGKRAPVVDGEPNKCEPNQGYATFVVGQRIYLPTGLRRRAADQPRAESPATSATNPALVALGFAAAVAGLWAFLRRKKAT